MALPSNLFTKCYCLVGPSLGILIPILTFHLLIFASLSDLAEMSLLHEPPCPTPMHYLSLAIISSGGGGWLSGAW